MSNTQLAFVFPGQGSQTVGMMQDFAEEMIVKQTFEEASETLGYDLLNLVNNGPEESLNETHRTQPALLAASTAMWRLWVQDNQLPTFVAGHSLGEYSALVAAGVIDFSSAVKLVEQRGIYMQQAVPAGVGKMAAIIGLSDDLILQACQEAALSEVVAPVNYNSQGQVVIAGNAAAVERAMALCKDKGAKRALPLPVSVPSHCSLMQSAAEALKVRLLDVSFKQPTIKIVNNVDVAVVNDVESIKDALVRQLYCPVRWTESVEYLASQGVTSLVECGPGKVLSGLIKRIDKNLTSYQLATKSSFNQSIEALSL